MDVIEAIMTRRSIREYTEEPVTDEQVQTLLEAAMAAPSANNKQPWHYLVIKDNTTLRKIKTVHPYAAMAEKAPLAILVCGDLNIDHVKGYLTVDCAAATQNILLAAHSMGLGTVWCGVYPRQQRIDAFRKMFDLPQYILPVSFIVVGHPAEKKDAATRFMNDRVKYEKW